MRIRRSEKGQVLVLIILAAVGMFGFAALAVDLGQVFHARRAAQNAADAAALAAANAGLEGLDPFAAGYDSAMLNAYNNDGARNIVTIHHPPSGGTPYDGDVDYYQVSIWTRVDPVFAQFVFRGQQATTVTAVAHAVGISSASNGNVIHALSEEDDALRFDGTTDVQVVGGNVLSNGGGVKTGASGRVRVTGGGILIAMDGGWRCTGCTPNTVQPPADDTGVDPRDARVIPPPYCPAQNETYDGVDYYVYPYGITGSMTLLPGIHCVHGDIQLAGGDRLIGHSVLIVMLDGGLRSTGNAFIQLTRASDLIDRNGHQYGGLLFYAPPGNPSEFTLGGTNDATWSGTVYLPGAECSVGGNSQGTANHSSIICYRVKIHGNPQFIVRYNPPENHQFAPMIELVQ